MGRTHWLLHGKELELHYSPILGLSPVASFFLARSWELERRKSRGMHTAFKQKL